MLKGLGRLARRLNWSRRRWSAAGDRAFHEGLYRSDDYDPFSLAYPGYTTIRRFADLVEPHLPSHGFVLDLGCGPAEITCELAARRPDLNFLGIDHSSAAIAKATANVARRRVANLRFQCAGVEEYTPPDSIELAMLFDSFHHLTDPVRFVRRLAPNVRRWALVEPRGSWAGTWKKDSDFDWLAQDLDKIRAHFAALVGERPSPLAPPAPLAPLAPPAPPGEAVERRYTLDDFERFFDKRDGWALDLRGTVAGLETYPPSAFEDSEICERFGELRYQIYRDIDEWLLARDLDLHAKHWLVVAERAERGGRSRRAHLRRQIPPPAGLPAVSGPYDVCYGDYRGPRQAAPGEHVIGSVQLTNKGWNNWSSDAEAGIFTSYHWLDRNGRVVEFDGERTRLPRTIVAGETSEVAISVRAPSTPGRYRLAIDLVREGVTWFSQAGRPWLEVRFKVS